MSQSNASPIITPNCTARWLTTGSAPGRPRQVGQVWVLGGSPKETSQPQNIFVRVLSWTWISSPMTASKAPVVSATPHSPRCARHPSVEADRLLQRVGGVEQAALAERRPRELESDRQAVAQAAGDGDRGSPGQGHRD